MDMLGSTRILLGIENVVSSHFRKIWVLWPSPFSVEAVQDVGQVIHYLVSHSSFPDPVLISYIYASCFIPVWEDLWATLMAFAETHDGPGWLRGTLL